jgi:anti-sigma regulatory factor (Ser/Thr protein kinase)
MKEFQPRQIMFAMNHTSDIAAARRAGVQLAESLGFNETIAGKLAIVITEASTNILKHAGNGTVFITQVQEGGIHGVQVLALDRGPGIANLGQSLRDGISSTGTAGTGLGAMRRQSDEFDVYSSSGAGSAFYMCLWSRPEKAGGSAPAASIELGAICVPVAGEDECGDAWALARQADSITILVADGLGHGPQAALASAAAVKVLQARPAQKPTELMQDIHQALRPTRGAAVALMELRLNKGELHFAGVGNISASMLDGSTRKQLVSHNGIVGNNMRKVQEFSLPVAKGSLCVLCSDGIGTQWDLDKYPGLFARHPALIAGVIYRDFVRLRDDATVVVVRYP